MISQGASGGGVDLAEVARDAELLDQLAARTAVPDDDAVCAMLSAFAAEVDDGLVALLDEGGEPARPAARPADRALVSVPDVLAEPRRGHGMRAVTIAVVLGATLSVSGVAAAVTGDPLSPYKGIVTAVQGGNHDELPANAAQVAKMNHKLVGTRAQIAHGDVAGAQATLAALRLDLASMTDLTTGQRHAIEARIAALEAAIGRATAHEKQQNSTTKRHTAVPQNTKAQQPNNTKTSEPSNTKTPDPNNTKSPEPNNTDTPEPADTAAPGSGGTHTAEPQNTKPTDSAVGGGGGNGGGGGQSAATATDLASTGGGGGGTAHGKGATR